MFRDPELIVRALHWVDSDGQAESLAKLHH